MDTIIDSRSAEKLQADELFMQLDSSPEGLETAQAQLRLAHFGRNALEEKKPHPLLKFLSYFWGPIPWMIEVAVILSGLARHWADFVIIISLLIFNAVIGFWQEHKAANALEALKNQLALMGRVRRDNRWNDINAAELVESAGAASHFQKAVLTIGNYLIFTRSPPS